ncbi:hypothetical protein BGZ76_005483 [Entomortierella beljakovae]|nr:hypothetical protein BGZ76_005483 [Entomortierella beljakovae]
MNMLPLLLDESDDLISEKFEAKLPRKTIHVVIKIPLAETSERQLVQYIPPAIIGVNQGEDGSGRSTRRRYLVPPNSISEWPNFLNDVRNMTLSDDLLYERPSFYADRVFESEATITAMFSIDVGVVRVLEPWAQTRKTRPIHRGDPDIQCFLNQGVTLFPIEVKRPYQLYVSHATLGDAYNANRHRESLGPVRPLQQIIGYMWCNGYRYGVLSTLDQTWFIRLRLDSTGNFTRDIEVSPTIHRSQNDPTLLQSYLWLIRQANQDPHHEKTPPSEQEINNITLPEHGNSDYKPTGHIKSRTLSTGPQEMAKSDRLKGESSQSKGKNINGQSAVVPSFKNMRLITHDEGAATFRATWQGEDVVVKKCDVWKDRWIDQAVMEEIEHETEVYCFLQHLQGYYIPHLKIAGIADGIDLILVTEYAGANISGMAISSSDRMKIRKALQAIHDAGVLHDDLRRENILMKQLGQDKHFTIIDFGLSKFTTDREKLKKEMDELDILLE